MACDLLRCARDRHLVDGTSDQHFAGTVGSRHRIVVAPVTHRRQRADLGSFLLQAS